MIKPTTRYAIQREQVNRYMGIGAAIEARPVTQLRLQLQHQTKSISPLASLDMNIFQYRNIFMSSTPAPAPTPDHPAPSKAMMELVAARFRALGDINRLRIVNHLRSGECAVGGLAEALDMGQASCQNTSSA